MSLSAAAVIGAAADCECVHTCACLCVYACVCTCKDVFVYLDFRLGFAVKEKQKYIFY